MGWLTDVGYLAVGAIERDREITKEDLAIRAENLQANRDILIKQKDAKYKKELDAYYEEKKKFDAIEKANKNYDLKSIDAQTYASQVLPIITTGWKDLPDDIQKNMIRDFDGATQNYKLVGSEEEINKKAAAAQTLINNQTSKEIKEAKGNSFLINQILGKKERAEKDIYKAIEAKLNAAETIKMTEKEVNQDYVGKEVKVSSGNSLNAFINAKNSDKYQDEWKKQRGTINFDLSKDNNKTFKFLNLTGKLGGNDEISYKFNKTDSKIEGMNAPATENLLAMQYMFNEVKNSDDTMVNHYYNVTKLHGNIAKTWNTDVIYNKMSTLLDGRGGNISEKGLDLRTDIRLTTFIPLSLVNQNNEMVFNNGTVIDFKDKSKMKDLSDTMNAYIVEKSNAMYSKNKNIDEQNQAGRVYERLYKGDTDTMKEFLTYAAKENPELFKDINMNTESTGAKIEGETNTNDKTIIDNKPTDTNPKINYQVTKENGEDGLSINGVFNSWKKIEQVDAVKDLPPAQLIEYEKWKKITTENKSTIPLFNQKTKEDVITPAIKNTVKKIDAFGNEIETQEGEFGNTGA